MQKLAAPPWAVSSYSKYFLDAEISNAEREQTKEHVQILKATPLREGPNDIVDLFLYGDSEFAHQYNLMLRYCTILETSSGGRNRQTNVKSMGFFNAWEAYIFSVLIHQGYNEILIKGKV